MRIAASSSRHVQEMGSHWFRTLADPGADNAIIMSRVGIIEVYSALNWRLRETSLNPADYAQLADEFTLVCLSEYQVIEVTASTIDAARVLLERYPLRAYDALQLASAQVANQSLQAAGLPALTFLAADDRLLRAAEAEGFATDNPNLHP
jgi:predicted nucleic acid-binding protein